MLHADPGLLAARQIEIDRDRTARFPHLFAHKRARMTASPLALLRGSAPLFYEFVARQPSLADGPPGEGWIVGDAHLENFGAWRAGEAGVVFDLNDFDDAVVAPWRFDVTRLVTSLVLAGREMGTDGPSTLALADALLEAYVDAVFETKKPARSAPHAVRALVEKVRDRTREQLLDARTRVVRGERRFVRGPRYEPLPKKVRVKVERALRKYAERLPDRERGRSARSEAFDVVDAAFRVAGTGSLGCLRVAVLARGKGGRDGAWIFDMKEESDPSAWRLVRPGKLARLLPAERVCEAMGACLARPPRTIGTTKLRGASMFVRRLAPQEDKLDWTKLHRADLDPLARHLGALLGAAHGRAATRFPKKAWKAGDRAHLVRCAIGLAGVHEAMYLAYCDLARR